jgi:hypothetical protein
MAQVRDAGTDAWLGKEAPEDSDLDVPEGEEALLALPPATNSESAPAGTLAQRDNPRNPLGFGACNKHHASYQFHGTDENGSFSLRVALEATQQARKVSFAKIAAEQSRLMQ